MSIVAVTGAAAGSVKTTAAINLAVALAVPGLHVRVCDLDPTRAATRALCGAPGDGTRAVDAREVLLSRHLRGSVTVADRLDGLPGGESPPPDVVVMDCPPALDEAATGVLRRARVVLVPVDAAPLTLDVLDAIARSLGPTDGADASTEAPPRLRLALGRVLPRSVDRWAVVDRLTESYPGALYATTIPMGRRAAAGGGRPATLYAPTTRAAAAYAALAREMWAELAP